MKQMNHAWAAIRAVTLLSDDPSTRALAGLLVPHLGQAAVGAWLPDQKLFKSGVGDTQNHVLKMRRYEGDDAQYYVVPRKKLLRQLGGAREMAALLQEPGYADRLPEDYWSTPFRGDCPRGEHPANCAMGLATTLADMIVLGDTAVQDAARRKTSLEVPDALRARPEQIALYFFMLSHFVADAHMPCHTDGRPLALYNANLHPRWEKHLDDVLVGFPAPADIAFTRPAVLLERARKAFAIDEPAEIPALRTTDVWTEVIAICRGAFALSCIAAPVAEYPLDGKEQPAFEDLFDGDEGKALLDRMTSAILHDTVLDIATVWKSIWAKAA